MTRVMTTAALIVVFSFSLSAQQPACVVPNCNGSNAPCGCIRFSLQINDNTPNSNITNVNILANDLSGGNGQQGKITAVDLFVFYDPAVVQFHSYVVPTFLGWNTGAVTLNNDEGSVNGLTHYVRYQNSGNPFEVAECPANSPIVSLRFSGLQSTATLFVLAETTDVPASEYSTSVPSDNDICTTNGSGTVTLPLTLLRFSANITFDKNTELYWTTTDQDQVSHFEIEYSPDGVGWVKIGEVAAEQDAAEFHSYTYIDQGARWRTNTRVYYRLRMVDLDGAFTYSPVETVQFQREEAVRVSPNPASSVLWMQWAERSDMTATLYDLSGRVLLQEAFDDDSSEGFLPVHDVTPGVYLLSLRQGGHQIAQQKIIISR